MSREKHECGHSHNNAESRRRCAARLNREADQARDSRRRIEGKITPRVVEALRNTHYTQAVVSLVHAHFMDNGKALDWLTTENPLLGGIKPIDMAQAGRAKRLCWFVVNMMQENEA